VSKAYWLGVVQSLLLQNFAVGEVADEAAIRGEEVVTGQVLERDPADVVKDVIDDFAFEGVDRKELQVDSAAVAVRVMNPDDVWADLGTDAKFFLEFTSEGLFGGFAGLDFATGELPLEGHGLLSATLANENRVCAQDQRSRDEAYRLCPILLNVRIHALLV